MLSLSIVCRTRSSDDKFLGTTLAHRLGLLTPRSVVLPNKRVETQVVAESFRNLEYPMNWRGIIDYVGVPAILKDAHTGGRRVWHRVHNVDDLIQKYDESDTLTMIVQESIESDVQVNVFVVGQQEALAARYSPELRSYLAEMGDVEAAAVSLMKEQALALTRAYGYDVNLVEFILRDGAPVVVSPTNPAPDMDINVLKPAHFSWCVNKLADFAIAVAVNQQTAMPQAKWQ
jgi:hypothetical protein